MPMIVCLHQTKMILPFSNANKDLLQFREDDCSQKILLQFSYSLSFIKLKRKEQLLAIQERERLFLMNRTKYKHY